MGKNDALDPLHATIDWQTRACYFFDSRSLDDRRACRANWQHAATREFPDRANLCTEGCLSSRRRAREFDSKTFFIFSFFFFFLNPLCSRNENARKWRNDDDGRFVTLSAPLTASIGTNRDANANEFTCERSLEFEVVWINEINAEGWEILYIYIIVSGCWYLHENSNRRAIVMTRRFSFFFFLKFDRS